jgi:predicted  nucleic acid-binding Zn-ribbon protein
MAMAHPLEALLVLQEKDRKIAKLQREIRDIPARKADIDKQLEGGKIKLTQAREALKKVTADLKQLEIEVESLREKITKYKQQQMEAKNNDQYRAFLQEIAAAEKSITGLEDREMVLMEHMESAKKIIAEREAELKEEEDGVSEEKEMLEERLSEVQEDLDKLTADRGRITSTVNPSLLSKYDRLFKNKGDFAVVKVENNHCSGCHMKLPPQVTNDALNPDKLVICNFCGRMLINLR